MLAHARVVKKFMSKTYNFYFQGMQTMAILSLIENFVTLLWAMSPYSFSQAMISTPIFAIINIFGLPFVTFKHFGHFRDGIKSLLNK